jgi:hypothetical protein
MGLTIVPTVRYIYEMQNYTNQTAFSLRSIFPLDYLLSRICFAIRKNLSIIVKGFFTGLLVHVSASAQHSQDIAVCSELKAPAMVEQIEICKAHAGCRMVMSVQSTCIKAQIFFSQLKIQVG